MRKTLLIAAASLAASIISSQAGVYSQNIVGYVNSVVPNNFTVLENTLDNGNGNSATNLFDTTSGNNDGSILYLWTGTNFSQLAFSSGSPSGFINALTTAVVPAPVLNPGTAFFLNNQSGAQFTNTFVGTVHVDGAATGAEVVGSTTNLISDTLTYVFIGSKLPVGGGISSVLQLTNDASGDLDGSILYIPKISVSGQLSGYTETAFASGSPTGFINAITTANVAEPQIPVGAGFLFSNQSGEIWPWVQQY